VQDHYGAPCAASAGGPLGRAFSAAVAALSGQAAAGGKGSTTSTSAYNPSPLLAAVCKVAPQFKVRKRNKRHGFCSGPSIINLASSFFFSSLFPLPFLLLSQGRQQQDSHELLRFLLDGVRAEEEKAAGVGKPAKKGGAAPTQLPDPAASPSFAERVFGGQLASAVACGCGSASTTLEPFMDLSLPVPQAARAQADEDRGGAATPTLVLRPPKKKEDASPAAPLTSKQVKRAAKAAAQATKAKAKETKKAAEEVEEVAATAAAPPPATLPPPLGPPGALPPPEIEDDGPHPTTTPTLLRESFASELGEDVTSPTHSAGGGAGASDAPSGSAGTFHTPVSALADSATFSGGSGSGGGGRATPPSVSAMSTGGPGGGAPPPSSSSAPPPNPGGEDDIARLYAGQPAAPPPPPPARGSDAGADAGSPSPSSSSSSASDADGDVAGMAGLCTLFDSAANVSNKGGDGDDGSQPGTPTLAPKPAVPAPAAAAKPRGGGIFASLAAFGGNSHHADVLDAEAAPGTDLQACLAAFFAPEAVEWECPAAAAARMEKKGLANGDAAGAAEPSSPASSSSSSSSSFGTPAAGVVSHGLDGDEDGDGTPRPPPPTRPSMRRSVSFCEAGPRVKLIPGSAEQRGTNFAAALRGDDHFVRPLRFGGACLMVTAHIDAGGGSSAPWEASRDKLHVEVHRQDDEPASLAALPASLAVATVDIDSVDDSDDEAEQARVRTAAQALMDCVADAVAATGSVDGMRRMVADGLSLARVPPGEAGVGGGPTITTTTACGGWKVKGVTPGEGPWVYPAAPTVTTTQPPSAAASPVKVGGLAIPGAAVAAAAAATTPAPGGDPTTGETSPRSAALSHFAGPGSPPVGGWMEKVLTQASAGGVPVPGLGNGRLTVATGGGGGGGGGGGVSGSSTKAAMVEEDARPAAAAGPTPPPPSTHAGSHKRYRLHRAPPLLTLHLKRFERDGRGRLRKLGGHIAFPLVLKAGAALVPSVAEGAGVGAAAAPPQPKKGGKAVPAPANPAHQGPTYGLVGVVEHLGSMQGGHYVAYVQRERKEEGGGGKRSGGGPPAVQWYRASDTSVSPVSEGGLMACEAYLLLYARRDEDDI